MVIPLQLFLYLCSCGYTSAVVVVPLQFWLYLFDFPPQVEQANRLIALEAEENLQQTQQTGKYAAPEVFAERTERPPRVNGVYF